MRRLVALVALSAAAVAGCGGDDDEAAVTPRVVDIAPAIAALEERLGGPQRYFEVNATPQAVNLFVATDASTVAPYVDVGGELAPAGEPADAEGATFAADALTFDPRVVLDGVREELPDGDIVRFTAVAGPGGAVRYAVSVASEAGGTLDVVVGPDGDIVSVDPG